MTFFKKLYKIYKWLTRKWLKNKNIYYNFKKNVIFYLEKFK